MNSPHPAPRQEPTQLARFKREYAVRRQRQALSTIPVGILAVATALGAVGAGVVGVVILGFFGFSLVNWRCPACDAYLGQRLNPRSCPSCGQQLRD